jgi:hypothetical protein
MKKVVRLIFWIWLGLMFSQCKKEGCLYSSGEYTTQVLVENPFDTIEVWGLFNIELVQDTSCFVEALGGSNVVDRVEAEVVHSSLSLYNYNNCFWYRDYEKVHLRIHFEDIKRILVHQTSLVYSVDSITDNFLLEIRGDMAETDLILNNEYIFFLGYMESGGKYKFRGISEKIRLQGYYTSVVDASELKSSVADIRNYSISDYKVWVTDELKVQIHNRGNVYLKGNPDLVFDSINSSGKLIPLD